MSNFYGTDSKIAEQGVLRHNCMLDTGAMQVRRSKRKAAALSNNVDGEHVFDVCDGEVLLKVHRASKISARQTVASGRFYGASTSSCLPVLSSLNGAGEEGQTNVHLHREYKYAGIVVTQGKANLDGGYAPDTFPADLQGLRTLFNNGRGIINVGDHVMYDFPKNPKDAREKMVTVPGTPPGRVLPYLCAFNPQVHSFSRERMAALREKAARRPLPMTSPDWETGIADYNALHSAIVQILALGGVIRDAMIANGAASNFDVRSVFVNRSETDIANTMSLFGIGMGVQATNTTFVTAVSSIADSLLAYRATTDVFPQGKGNAHSVLRDIITNLVPTMAYAWKRLDWEAKSRVIGLALSSGDIGQFFDIFLEQPRA